MIKLQTDYAGLPADFSSPMEVPNTWQPSLLAFNHALAEELGFDFTGMGDQQLARYFSAAEFIPDSRPVAMAYAGHQFGHFVPQLGDGRAVLLGEITSRDGTLYDVHLKGSGRTMYSRRGDGRSALGPVIREYIVSEGMAALGVPTTRTLCAVRTGETVMRDGESPGGVLARVARSHIRVGTFQFFAARGDSENLNKLADYTIRRLYPELADAPDRLFLFWKAVGERQMRLTAQWMSLGFIHGVMNTDNMNISGETIDYGPCAFMDEYHFNKVFSSIDQQGRYAYGNQGKIALWNLARLAECLMMIMEGSPETNGPRFSDELTHLHELHHQEFIRRMSEKLGLTIPDEGLVQEWLQLMQNNELDFTLSFIDLENNSAKLDEAFRQKWQQQNPDINLMKRVNPSVIPRNHQVERAIQAANAGDDSVFHQLVEAVRRPYVRSESPFQEAPTSQQRVTKTFCGT